MIRVVSGAARGRRLEVPVGHGTRPTSDRAREALFSTLGSLLGTLEGTRLLDLYAGTGAVGLEALSRGAAGVTLVESDPRTARTLRRNVDALGLGGAEVISERVERVVATPPREPYDVAFADPPYAAPESEVLVVLGGLRERGWLRPDGVVVVERPTRGGSIRWPPGYAPERSRRYGEATLWYGRVLSVR